MRGANWVVMLNTDIPLQIRYLHEHQSEALDASIREAAALLSPFRELVGRCQLELGRWSMHHGAGVTYRVSLEVETIDGRPALVTHCESAVNPDVGVGAKLVHEAFARAARRLAALERQRMDLPGHHDSRNLNPLHGQTAGLTQLGAGED